MSLMEAVALTYLVSAVIVIGVVPMLLNHPPAWLVHERYNLRAQQRRVAMAEREYETVWNGTMERNGQHPGLSRMTGPSSAQLNMDLPEAVELVLTTRTTA